VSTLRAVELEVKKVDAKAGTEKRSNPCKSAKMSRAPLSLHFLCLQISCCHFLSSTVDLPCNSFGST
jgi:hypothetical protein